MIRGSERRKDRVSKDLRIGGKEQIKNVCSVTVVIWNTCRVLNNLFQLLGNGKIGFPRVNENGECLVELCEERSMVLGNT